MGVVGTSVGSSGQTCVPCLEFEDVSGFVDLCVYSTLKNSVDVTDAYFGFVLFEL